MVDFPTAPYLAVIGLGLAVFFATMISYSRSERTGNTRWRPRAARLLGPAQAAAALARGIRAPPARAGSGPPNSGGAIPR